MVLGSVYAGGAYFFARRPVRRALARVATGFPSVIVFVWMAAIATLLHLDRFIKDSAAVRGLGGAVRGHAVPRAVAVRPQPPALRRAGRARRCRAALPLALGVVGGALLAAGRAVPDRARRGDRRLAVDADPADRAHHRRGARDVRHACGSRWRSTGRGRASRIPLEAHAIGLAFCCSRRARRGRVDWDNALAVVSSPSPRRMLVISAAALAAGRVGCARVHDLSPPSCASSAACSRSSARRRTPIR